MLLAASLCAILTASAAADVDVGAVAVLEADPTILQPGEPFDLDGKTLTFTPRTGGGYDIAVGPAAFDDSHLGSPVTFSPNADDGFVQQPLAFTFRFFGVDRTSVFINTNGNLTFVSGSILSHFNGAGDDALFLAPQTDASGVLSAIASGPPRIAVLWEDWFPHYPAPGGTVFANSLPDRLIVTWSAVPLFDGITTATFQVVLQNDGKIVMTYRSVPLTPAGGYLVGISPGGVIESVVTTLDLSRPPAGSITTQPTLEPLVQVFGSTPSPLVHIPAVSRRFFRSHPDAFDQLVTFTNFPNALGNAFAFELPVQETVSGVGQGPPFLPSMASVHGSAGRLQGVVHMSDLSRFPADPAATFFGTNSTLDILGQETGHAWMVFVHFNDGTICSDLMLGRDLAHWSFFFNSDASEMEGNQWGDNGNGTFTSIDATSRFSALDQYLMGLRAAPDVPSSFLITNPTGTGGRTRATSPTLGVTVGGTRRDITLQQVIACEGARAPATGFSTVNQTTTWRQAFILLTAPGVAPADADVSKVERIRAAWQPFFGQATGGRGSLDTALPSAILAVIPGALDFQVVQVGAFRDLTLTATNAGQATLTGAASATSPFACVAGCSYALGAGQSQAVTIRFAPVQAATASGTVTFTGGQGITRPVTGQGTVAAPSAALTLSGTQFQTGQTITVGLHAENPDGNPAADLYVGALLADTTTVVLFSGAGVPIAAAPLASPALFPAAEAAPPGWTVDTPAFLRFTFPVGFPPGTYRVFAALVAQDALRDGRIDAGDVLVLDVKPVVFAP